MANSQEQLKYLRDMLKRKAESSQYGSFVNPNDTNDFSEFMGNDDISQNARMQTDFEFKNNNEPNAEETPETPEDTINWWKRTVDSVNAVSYNVTSGLLNFFDSVGDLFLNVVDAIGGGVDWAQNARDFNWQDYANNALNVTASLINGDMYNGDYFASFGSQENAQQYKDTIINKSNYLSEAENVNNFMTDVEESIGFMLPSIVVGVASGGAATAAFGAAEGANAAAVAASAANVAKVAALGTMGVGSFASSYNEVYKETGDVPKSLAVGALSAGVEIGTELIFPEGKVMGIIGGKEVTATFGQFAKAMGKEFFEEGTEEVLSALAQPFIDEIYKDGSIKNAYAENPAQFFLGIGGNFNESVLGQGLAGGVSGIAMGGVSQAQINAEVDKLVGKEGRKLLAKGQELGEVANDYFADVKKGKLTNEELKNKYSDLFGKKGGEWLEEWSKLNGKLTIEQKKNFARLIANPAEVIREQIQDTNEDYSKFIERTIKSKSDINKVEATGLTEYINKAFNSNLSVDFLSEDLIKNRTELENYLGYNLSDKQYNQLLTKGEAYNEGGNIIVLNEKYKDQYNRLIAHEALSHGILDSNEELRNKLLKDLSNNQEFYNAWKEYFKSAKNVDTIAELYGLQGLAVQNISKEQFNKKMETLNSEQMASFVEFIMSNTNLIKTLDNVSSNKLQTIIRRALNKLKASKNNSLTKATNLLENTLKAIKSQNNGTNANRQQMAFSVDSQGNQLSKEQQEFFKDSKVRDENGNLLVVYHGTNEDFTVFDRTKTRANMDIQGNFFSPYRIEAEGYGLKVGAYYLNITNPANEGQSYAALNKYKGQNNAGVKARDYLISQGYDGVIGYDECIAFEPNQIKSIDNKKPTSNPDIRFSLNNNPIEYKFDKEKVQEYNYDNFEEVKKFVHFDDWSKDFRGIEEIKKIFNGEISVVNNNKNLEQLAEFYLNAKYYGRVIGNDGIIPTAILPPELLLLKKQIEKEEALTYFRVDSKDHDLGNHESTFGNKFGGKITLDIEEIALSSDTIYEVLRHERMHHYRDNLQLEGVVEKKFEEPLFELLKSKHNGERTLYDILKNYLSNLYEDRYYKQALDIIGNETVLGKERIATRLMKTFSVNEFTKYLNQDKETLAKTYNDYLIDEEILTFTYSQTKLFDAFFKKENILGEVSEIRNNFREEMKKQYNTPEILFSLSGNNSKADTVRESRYYANSYATNVISYTNAQQIFTNIIGFLNNHFNISIDTTIVNDIARDLTIDFNTISSADDLSLLKNKMKIMSMIILDVNLKETVVGKDGKEKIVINENMTLRDAIKSAGMSDTWFEDFLGEQLYKAFEKKSDKSRINKVVTEYIDRLNEALLEIKNRKLITYYTIKTQKSMLGLKDKFNKHTFSGTNRKAVDSPLLKFYKEILNNSLKVNVATKSKLGISPKFVNQLLLDLQSYNAEALKEKYDWIELEEDLEGNSLVEQYRNALIDSLSTKANPNLELTYEEMEATYNLIGTLSKELSNLIKDEGANRRKQVRKADLELRSLEKAYSDGKNFLDTNVIQRELNKASSPDTVIKNYFGSNSDVYKIVFNDVFNSTSNQLLKQQEFIDQFNEIKEKFGITDKVLNKKVEVTFNGKTFNVATKVLLDIYTMTLTEATYKTITNGGYRFNDGKTSFKIALNETDILKLNDYLGDNLRSFAEEVLLDLYNGTARDYKSERDAHIKGYKVLLFNDFFYPSNKADSKVSSLEQNDYGVINFENTSINKERKKAYHMPLLGMGFEERLFSYINALTKYGEMSDSLKTLNTFLNGFTKDSELDKPIKRRSVFGNVTNELRTIFDYLYERIGGKNDYIKSGSKFFSNIVQATLYGNPSVVLKQTASLPTILNEVRASSFFKAFKDIPYNVKNYKAIKQELMKNSGFLADRWNNNEIIRAEALTNYLNKFSKIFGVPMEKMDEAVIIAFGYGAAIEESNITGEDPIKILERIVANTQSNAIQLKISMARSGAAGYLRKFLSYFTSDLQNKVSLINNLINEKRIAKKAIVGVESMIESTQVEIKELEELGNEFTAEDMATEEYQEYLDKLEEKKDKLANLEAIKADKQAIIDTNNVAKGSKLILSLTMSALIIASITELVKRLLGKKDWKWDEETTKDFAITLALESTINNLPYVSTILNSIEYNNKITGLDISILNQFITILNDLYKQIQGNGDWVSTLKDVTLTLGNMTGLPISNLYKYGVGIYKNVSPNGYKVDAIVQSYSPTYILNEYKDAINKGMNKKASGYLELVMSSRAESSDEVRKEINSLYKDGYNALPKPYLTSYTNENGETASLTEEQINAFKTEYNKANAQVEKLMQLTDYKTKTSEEKSKLIKKIYDTYYSYAKAKVLKLNKADNKLSTLLLYSNGRINVSKFVNILGKIGSITESKNKTRKELVFAYVNRLGLNTNEKLLLLYLAGYSSQSNNQRLTSYLRSLGLNIKKAKSFLGVE